MLATPPVEDVASCDLCGSTRATPLFETRDRLHELPGRFALVRCDSCGLVRLSPRPTAEALSGYYPGEDYGPHRPTGISRGDPDRPLGKVRDALRDETLRTLGYPEPPHRPARPIVRLARKQLLRRLAHGYAEGFPRHVTGGRALDVGCGNGFFLALIRDVGWSVEGVDLSPTAAAVARESLGIDVHVGDVFDDALPTGAYDYLRMNHVVEHVPSPTATLRRVAELLRPGGMAYIETPNVASVGFRLYRRHWFALDSPRHLYLFTPSTLRRTVEQAGLELVSLQTLVWDRLSWEETYRWEDRKQQARSPRPSAPPSARPRMLLAASTMRLAHALRPLSGDVLSCWVRRAPR